MKLDRKWKFMMHISAMTLK